MRNEEYALKGQKQIAQGNALGMRKMMNNELTYMILGATKMLSRRGIMRLQFVMLTTLISLMVTSCAIEPPLYLPAQRVLLDRQAVDLKVEAVWENPYWESEFLYGWTADDIDSYGDVVYEAPYDYEVRLYFKGQFAENPHLQSSPATMIEGKYFRTMFVYGYHDVLAWSNIYTPDHTQSVIIAEELQDVNATVSRNNGAMTFTNALAYHLGMSPATIYNQPDIFFSAYLQNLHVTPDPADYDYYDNDKMCWVKKVEMPAGPLVYIYLVQVVLRNNNGKITGISNGAALSGVTCFTNVNTGLTSDNQSSLHMDMGVLRKKVVNDGYLAEHHSGFKSKCTLGENVDVIGGRFTTYGLCGMPGYLQEKSSHYSGTQPSNQNLVALDLSFKNGCDSIVMVDVSRQMQHTCHGGVLTIELNADDIPMPNNPNPPPSGGSGFDPWIENYKDSIVHEFGM